MRKVKNLIAVALTLAMLLSSVPITAFAEYIPDTTQPVVEAQTEPDESLYEPSQAELIAEQVNTLSLDSAEEDETEEEPEQPQSTELANSGTWENGTWSVSGSKMTISGEGEMNSNVCTDANGRVTTFAEVASEKVVMFLTVGNGITSLPDHFIENNSSIRYVGIPDRGLTKIGKYAFANTGIYWILNNYIFNVAYANSPGQFHGYSYVCNDVEEIGEYAFAKTEYLNVSFMLPMGLKEIPEGCFFRSNITEAFLFGNVESIGKKAFAGSQLHSIDIPISVTEIYEDENDCKNNALGFDRNGNKTELKIRSRYDSVPYAYAEKYGFDFEYSYGNCVGSGTIKAGSSLLKDSTYLTFNKSFYQVNWQYFAEDKSVIITPKSDDGESYKSFVATSKFAEIDCNFTAFNYYLDNVLTGNMSYSVYPGDIEVDKVVVKDLTKIKANGVFSLFNPKYIELPNTLTALDYYAFKDCKRLKSISIPDSVTFLGSKTFQNNSSLEGVRLGNGITEIPNELFYNCKQLKFVELGENVQKIGERAFCNCVGLQEIVIPDSVNRIDAKAFYNCISVQELKIGSGVTRLDYDAFSNLIYCERVYLNANLPYYVNPATTFTSLGDYTTGTEIIVGENVTDFVHNGFDIEDNNVTKVTISGNPATNATVFNQFPHLNEISVGTACIDYYTFDACLYTANNILLAVPRAKNEVSIAQSCVAIGDNACAMTSAKTIRIPKNVELIGREAFADSNTLKEIAFAYGSLRHIGEGAFKNCVRLKTFVSPDKITRIENSTFEGCSNLASVIFSEKLTTVGDKAFRGCTSLKTVVVPELAQSLGGLSFADCSELEAVYIWETDFTNNSFNNCPKLNIYTMAGSRAYEYARANSVDYSAYTDEDCFFDECAVKLDALAGYIGICENGHGDIEWLTVYEVDCDNDGYLIGVCEYCSEILDERHISAEGHNFILTTDVPPTDSTKGIMIYTCTNCNDTYAQYVAPTTQDYMVESHNVTGRVVIAQNKNADRGVTPAKGATISIDGTVVARTDSKGEFSFALDTGTYQATISYAYGFPRDIVIVVTNRDLYCGAIPVIGCDFNKDGKIDEEDIKIFNLTISSETDDPSYLDFVDMDNNGYINAKDRAYINSCKGIEASRFNYPSLIIK